MRPALVFVLAASASAQELSDDPPQPPPVWEEILRLRARLEALERQNGAPPAQEPTTIDLSGDEVPPFSAASTDGRSGAPNLDHVLARPWFENLTLSGYGSFLYLDSGGTGTTPDGSFVVKEASLFFDAHVWERTFLFTEVWLARYQYGNGFSLNEFYLLLTDLFASGEPGGVGVKLGRFELPFGEEYLRWDANETPLITFSAADPYGVDEGVELYGAFGGVHWITAVTNGSSGGGADDGAAKLACAKLYGEPCADLYLSGSVLTTGRTERTALRLSGSQITAVGLDGASSAGTSPSEDVQTVAWEFDARVASTRAARLNLQLGRALVNDEVNTFDRDLTWFLVEPGFRLCDELELVLRWSEIGTFDDAEGYRFAAKIMADGESLGYDTSVMRRLSAGLRWSVNAHVAVKLEVGEDRFDLIDGSPLDAENDERLFFGIEVVGSF